MQYRRDIDGLRSIAILPVVLYHAGLPGVTGGFIGVDVFFVISGFLITSIVASEILENQFSLLQFYERRARRIVPALTAVVLATFMVGWFVLLPSELKSLGQSALATALFSSNIYFTLNLGYFTPAAEFAPLLHTWSLAVEEQFYLIFPPLLMLLYAFFGTKSVAWIVLVLSVLSLAAAVVVLPSRPEWVFYLIFFRAWELGIGALLALYQMPRLGNRTMRDFIGFVGLAAILIPVFVYDASTPFPGLAALPPVIGTAMLIYVGANRQENTVSNVLSQPILVWFGLISYSLYLWHWPVLAFIRVLREEVHLPLTIGLGAVVASVALAWLSYRFIEQPFRSKPPNGFSQNKILTFSAVALLGIISIGGLFHFVDGAPSRLPQRAVALAAFGTDQNLDSQECFGKLPSEGLCGLGIDNPDDASLDFLFWGDSHADAMRYGIDLAAQQAGKRGAFVGTWGCPPIWQIRRSPENQWCTEINQSVRKFLQERTDAPTVILAARWTLSVEGSRYRQEAGLPVVLDWSGAAEARPSSDVNAQIFEAGLNATVEDILETGRRVVIVGPTPEIGWDVPRALARTEMLGALVDAPNLSETDFKIRAGHTESILSQMAMRHNEVEYLQLSDLFCAHGVCSVTDEDGNPLYQDDDHINHQTATSLLPSRLVEIWSKSIK